MKLTVKSLQSAIFTPSLDLTNKIGFANQLIQDTKGLFDGDPIVLPIPNDAPPEIPRIILKNKNDSHSLSVGQSRIDFFYNERDYKDKIASNEFANLEPEFLQKTNLVIQTILNTTSTRIIRLGLIITLQSKISGKASSFVSTHYLKHRKAFKDLYDLNLGVLIREKINKLDSNIWFRINPYRKEKDSLDDKIITFQFDINTKGEEILNLSLDDTNKYFIESASYINQNISYYIE